MKRGPVKKDWHMAVQKLEAEGCCRICGSTSELQSAHTINQAAQDAEIIGPRGGRHKLVPATAVIPLCMECHTAYDRHELDLLGSLYLDEEVNALKAAGGLYAAYRRLAPLAFKAERV